MTLESGVVNLGDFGGHFDNLGGLFVCPWVPGVVNLGELEGHSGDLRGHFA